MYEQMLVWRRAKKMIMWHFEGIHRSTNAEERQGEIEVIVRCCGTLIPLPVQV